jgi:hypothetical protein
MVGLAIWCVLESKKFTSLIGRKRRELALRNKKYVKVK